MSDEYEFMKHYMPWWDIGCDACGVSEGVCECKWNWDMKFDDDRDSIPKSWAWLIAPKDLTCRYCGHGMSTYDGCYSAGEAYLKYRYAVAFMPDWVTELKEYA